MQCSRKNRQKYTMKYFYKPGFILIKERTVREKHQKSSSVLGWGLFFFFIVIRHSNKNPTDRGFPFPWPAAHHHSEFSWDIHSCWASTNTHTQTSLVQTLDRIKGRKSWSNWAWQKNLYWPRSMKLQLKINHAGWLSRILRFYLF